MDTKPFSNTNSRLGQVNMKEEQNFILHNKIYQKTKELYKSWKLLEVYLKYID